VWDAIVCASVITTLQGYAFGEIHVFVVTTYGKTAYLYKSNCVRGLPVLGERPFGGRKPIPKSRLWKNPVEIFLPKPTVFV
jgi:hypothetical protein